MRNRTLAEKHQWFLEAAVTTSIPLFGLRNMQSLYGDNYPLPDQEHGLTETEICQLLSFLCADGLIEIIHYESAPELEEDTIHCFPSESITPATMEALLNVEATEDESIWMKSGYYRLTEKGGAYWESLAHPNWDDYVDSRVFPNHALNTEEKCSDDWPRHFIRCIEGLNQSVIRESIRIPAIRAFPAGPEEWSVLAPWQATYWKTFPQGYKVVFPCSSPMAYDYSDAYIDAVTNFKEIQESERWKVFYRRRWYQSPWRE